jgi:hypothetical protein
MKRLLCRLVITRVSDGERRTLDGEHLFFEDDGESLHTFIWSDGNYHCDCNRAGFFAEAGGEEGVDEPCTNGKYHVRIEDIEDGGMLYEDEK